MIYFQIDDKTYQLKTQLSEITFGELLDIIQIQKQSDLSNLEKSGKIISLLSDLNEDLIFDAEPLLVVSLFQQVLLFEELSKEFEPITQFTHNSHTYHVKDLQKCTFKEFADWEKSTNVLEGLESYPYQLAILSRLPGEAYEDYDVMQRAESFRSLPATTVLGVTAFFLSSSQEYERRLANYSFLIQLKDNLIANLKRLNENYSSNSGGITGGGLTYILWRKLLLRFLLSKIST